MTGALLSGAGDVLRALDVRIGGRLLFVADVRQVEGIWLIDRYELIGESVKRLGSLESPGSAPPDWQAGRLYLQRSDGTRASAPDVCDRLSTASASVTEVALVHSALWGVYPQIWH